MEVKSTDIYKLGIFVGILVIMAFVSGYLISRQAFTTQLKLDKLERDRITNLLSTEKVKTESYETILRKIRDKANAPDTVSINDKLKYIQDWSESEYEKR